MRVWIKVWVMPKLGDNQWTKMEKAERKAAKAQAVQEGRIRWVRTLIGQGKLAQAQHYSGTYLLPYEEMLAEHQAKVSLIEEGQARDKAKTEAVTEARTQAVAEATNIRVTSESEIVAAVQGGVEQVNGWPVRAEVEVYRYPKNKRLSIVRFDDGREAACWNDSTRAWTLKSRIRVVMESAVGDPLYRAEEGQR